jgi:serine/threonine-protein kinase RsbW
MVASLNPPDPNPSSKAAVGAVELKITSDTANLRDVRKRAEEFAKAVGFPQSECDAIGLAINEALANVIRHGYGGAKDRPIVVAMDADKDQMRISIRDWQKPFDPAGLPKDGPNELKPGGLGVMCIRKLMDHMNYQRLSDGMLLTLVKQIKSH